MTSDWPPGPRPLPVFRNLLTFRQDPLAFYTTCAREYGDVARYRIGRVNVLLLSYPAFVEQVLLTDAASSINGRVLRANRRLFGDGLVTSEGDSWRQQRRLVQTAFHRDRMAAYAAIITAQAEQMRAAWQDGAIRDVHQDLKHLTLGIIAQILCGAEMVQRTGEVGGWVQVAREAFEARLQSGLLIPDLIPTPAN